MDSEYDANNPTRWDGFEEMDDDTKLIERLTDRIRNLESRLAAAMDALKRMEWSHITYGSDGEDEFHNCPSCNQSMEVEKGHKPNCYLAAAIERIGRKE